MNLGILYLLTRDSVTGRRGLLVSWFGRRFEWAIQFGFGEPVQWTGRRVGRRTLPVGLWTLLVWAAVAFAAGTGWHL